MMMTIIRVTGSHYHDYGLDAATFDVHTLKERIHLNVSLCQNTKICPYTHAHTHRPFMLFSIIFLFCLLVKIFIFVPCFVTYFFF